MSKSLNEKYNSKRFNLNINKDLEKLNTHLELLNNLYNFNSTPDKTGYINKDYLIQEDILKVYRNKIEFLKNNIISKLDNLYNEKPTDSDQGIWDFFLIFGDFSFHFLSLYFLSHIKFYFSSGNIHSGRYRIYGIR